MDADGQDEKYVLLCKKHSGPAESEVLCTACVHDLINPLRLELARILLDKETLEKKVNHVLEPDLHPPTDDENKELGTTYKEKYLAKVQMEQAITEEEEVEQRLGEKEQELDSLRAELEKQKAEFAQRKARLDQAKQAQLVSRQEQLSKGRQQQEKDKARNDMLHNRSVDARAVLCRETASLLRLRQVKKKSKDGSIKECYAISGLWLPDLRDINNMRCTELTAVLGHTAFLVYLCSYFAGIQLPCEITVPHKDYPLTTIFPPLQSWLGKEVPFPGSISTVTSTPSSPAESRSESSNLPRPRPLFIGSDDLNEHVSQFAKKDPSGFGFFVEGISCLAYNIAWFSRSQGFLQGTETWAEVCNIGRILYLMLIAPPAPAGVMTPMTQQDARLRRSKGGSRSSNQDPGSLVVPRLGSGSHQSMHSLYWTEAQSNSTRQWRLSKFNMVADPLKRHLLTEMNNTEWELLGVDEWDDGGERMDEAVFVKTRTLDGAAYDDARSIMTTATHLTNGLLGTGDEGKGKGKSGWTKVKSREKP
ncbi:hypothetical protein B0A52_01603 [Exophiala mesophila]|uniref:Autophagy-related protein 14 n=1 Tax=Exophiala mesophila TaxID=212818 RepID=A0A438NFH0_EXOME|nr:hypothetical protein B0A52_01603 [Exophiala mesophila]